MLTGTLKKAAKRAKDVPDPIDASEAKVVVDKAKELQIISVSGLEKVDLTMSMTIDT